MPQTTTDCAIRKTLIEVGQVGSDLVVVIRPDGRVAEVTCRSNRLARELGTPSWPGASWLATITDGTAAVAGGLLDPSLKPYGSDTLHVDHVAGDGGVVPMAYAAAHHRCGVVLHGIALSRLDILEVVSTLGEAATRSYVAALQRQGISFETLLLDVLAPAARRLGELWLHDACSFMDVTAGIGHLRKALLSAENLEIVLNGQNISGPTIILATLTGNQHTFGLATVAASFRNGGWGVQERYAVSFADLAQEVGRHWFAVLGFSIGPELPVPAARAGIQTLRLASCNPDIRIMVGGPMFHSKPELATEIGADLTAHDGPVAVRIARTAISARTPTTRAGAQVNSA